MEYREKRQRTTSVRGPDYHQKQDEDSYRINNIVNNVFKKSFTIIGNERYRLPKPETMFVEDSWEIEELQQIKHELNETKSKLNNYCIDDWQKHTKNRNKAKDIEWRVCKDIAPEFVTQAWCKFHEIVSKYPLVPKETIFQNNNKFVSLHLCEAPGAFVACLNHWLKTNAPTVFWNWLAMTFNPYYEGNSNGKMISDDRFIIHTLKNWFFGKDNTGNLMASENLEALVEKAKTRGKVQLVTADGSVNCFNDPGEQERIVVSLHFCEVVAAINILESGGNFLLKIFTTFEHQSICLIYFLSCVFQKVHFYKPVTSKEGNSEVYLICLNFKGKDFISPYLPVLTKEYGQSFTKAMFCKSDVPDSFVQQIISCAQVFKNHQREVIENNIKAYSENKRFDSHYEDKRISKLVADKYMSNFPLEKLHVDLQIIGNIKIQKNKNKSWAKQAPTESFNDCQRKGVLEPVDRLLLYTEWSKSIESSPKTFTFTPPHLCIDIDISLGKPYTRVQSSRFCSVEINEIYKLLFQVVDTEKDRCICIPIKENTVNYENNAKDLFGNSYKIVNFEYTQIYDNNETLACIKKSLENLQKGENLIIFGFLLLTQFNVGLIHLLSHTFETVDFTTDELIGCCINFRGFKSREIVLQKLEQVFKTAETALNNNSTILSVASALEIYDSDLFHIIMNINNWIAKYCVNYISSIHDEFKRQDLLKE